MNNSQGSTQQVMAARNYLYLGFFQIFLLVFVIKTYASFYEYNQRNLQQENVNTMIYPNPVNTSVVTIESETEIKEITVLNIVGKPVNTYRDINSYKFQMEVDKYKSGIYLIAVTLKTGEVSINKIIIE